MRSLRILLVTALLVLPVVSIAQLPTTIIPPAGTLSECNFVSGKITFECVPVYIAYIIQYLFAGIGTFALLQIIYAGYEYAMGSTGMGGLSTDNAKQRLTRALVGLAFALLSFAIMNFIIASIT